MHPRHEEMFARLGLLTVEQCAAKWGLGKQNIIDRINGGGLPTERVMGRYYGIKPDVDPRTPAEKKLSLKQLMRKRAEVLQQLRANRANKKPRIKNEWDFEITKTLTILSMRQRMRRKLLKNSATQANMQLETFSTSQKS